MTVSLTSTPGGSDTRTFTLRRGGVDTVIACTIADPDVTCSDTGTVANTAPGSTLFSIQNTVSGAPAAATAFFTVECD
jgi:hypothetical protein